jgi:hypothetical protein
LFCFRLILKADTLCQESLPVGTDSAILLLMRGLLRSSTVSYGGYLPLSSQFLRLTLSQSSDTHA